MRQVWVPYWEWEDYKAGMWRSGEDERLQEAVEFTGNHVAYGAAMQRVVFEWPRTMLNALSGGSGNKQAFVGHCAACLERNLPESTVREAWKLLTDEQRTLANLEADKAILAWKKKFDNI